MTLHKNRRHSAHISGSKQIFPHKTCKEQGIITLNNTSKGRAFKFSLNTTETFQQDDIRKQQNTKGFQPSSTEGWRGEKASDRATQLDWRIWAPPGEHLWHPRDSVQVSQALGENPKEVKAQGKNYCMAVFKIICSVTICVKVS